MTNPTPHGQVPEALIDLIDAYAETRHRCGGIYNARTEAARKAVIEALSGVQALSAAPAIGDELRDTLVAVSAAIAERDDRAAQKMICEILAASTTPPAEQQAPKETSGGFHVWRDISTAPKDGSRFVAIGYNYGLYSEGRHICVAQWFRGCWMETSDWNEASELQHLTHWLPLPSPPDNAAELNDLDVSVSPQQAAPKAAQADPGYSEKWDAELGRTAMRFVDRAGDVHPGIDDAETICAEFHKAMSEVIERMLHVRKMTPPKAAPVKACVCGEPQTSGTTHRVDGPCYVAAPKAASGEQNTVPAEWLEQAYREGWAACRDAETIGEEAEDWAFGNSTANSRMIDAQQAAPQQEAQEPHGWLYEWTHSSATGKPDSTYTAFTTDEAHARKHDNCRAIYTAPQPAPAELERLRERIARMGLDVDRAMRGHVNEQSPLGTQRLAAIAALAKPAPAPLSEREAFERDWEKRHAPVPINGRTHDDGRYGDSSIQDAWESWQARAALAAQGGK